MEISTSYFSGRIFKFVNSSLISRKLLHLLLPVSLFDPMKWSYRISVRVVYIVDRR
jgi:hypothetical protein